MFCDVWFNVILICAITDCSSVFLWIYQVSYRPGGSESSWFVNWVLENFNWSAYSARGGFDWRIKKAKLLSDLCQWFHDPSFPPLPDCLPARRWMTPELTAALWFGKFEERCEGARLSRQNRTNTALSKNGSHARSCQRRWPLTSQI